jgi:hypothetical protein
MAEGIRQTKTKSMMYFENDQKPKHRTQTDNKQQSTQMRQVKTAVMSPGM